MFLATFFFKVNKNFFKNLDSLNSYYVPFIYELQKFKF